MLNKTVGIEMARSLEDPGQHPEERALVVERVAAVLEAHEICALVAQQAPKLDPQDLLGAYVTNLQELPDTGDSQHVCPVCQEAQINVLRRGSLGLDDWGFYVYTCQYCATVFAAL